MSDQPATASPARAARERMIRFGVQPKRRRGQNFLVDNNILGVIGRTAELDPGDDVLEIGGGLGVLTEYLATRAHHVHVVESDPGLGPALADATAAHANTTLLIADVMALDLAELRPAPGKVVANLPYGVAVPAIIKTIDELSAAHLWCVMVQREIAERLAAMPGARAYGAPSVLVQLACDVELVRPISRTVFHPHPSVDSALIRLRRRGPACPASVRRLVQGSFSHRRKALARSLELWAPEREDRRELRAAAREALEQMGHPAGERAERLDPHEFAELAGRLGELL